MNSKRLTLCVPGCFVPAKFAGFRLTDRIFCRMGTDDDVLNNSSSFMREMKETAYIVQNCSNNSLVLIDELGRGAHSLNMCYCVMCCVSCGVTRLTCFAQERARRTEWVSRSPCASSSSVRRCAPRSLARVL